jgi:hypothetical protein
MTAIWSNDGERWRLLAPSGFPDEASLQTLIEQSPQQLSTYHGKAGITTLLPRLSDGAGLVTIYKDTRAAYLEFFRSVFERRAPRALAAVEAAVGEPLRQGNVVYEVSDQLLAVLTAAYEEAAAGQLTT